MNTDEARNILTQIFNAPYEEADIQLCLGSAGNDDEEGYDPTSVWTA